jgi:hypothetical protein
MRLLALSVLALVALVGCDPIGPGASGLMSFPAADSSGFTTLELRFFPDLDGHFDLAGPPVRQADGGDGWDHVTLDLTTVSFPYAYTVGGSIGTSETAAWRIVAWLATASTTEWPNGSEPFATTEVTIDDCGGGIDGYCNITDNVDLVLETPATNQ